MAKEKVVTVTYHSTKDIKAFITKEGVRNECLYVTILGYYSSGVVEEIEEGREYYQVYVRTASYEFDRAVIDTTSYKKALQRAEQLLNGLEGYRGNYTKFVDHEGSFECDN